VRGRVLIVDDEPLVRRAVERLLQSRNDVTSAASASEAEKLVGVGEPYDVILCDLQMPRMSGRELYESLLSNSPAAAERVVFMSGGVVDESMLNFLGAVRNPMLEKPFEMKALHDLVGRMVQRRHGYDVPNGC
jgi:CheY-like chemotaxis protein